MKTKTFDCVEMMDQAALSIYEETKGMSLEEELAYWRDRESELSISSVSTESADPSSS